MLRPPCPSILAVSPTVAALQNRLAKHGCCEGFASMRSWRCPLAGGLTRPCVQVEAAGDHPERVFRLDGVHVTLAKWARAIDWTPRDDAMLLLGIYW